MISLGIDIGGTSVKAACLEDGKCLWTGRSEKYSRPDADELRRAISAAVGNRLSDFDRLGLCVPGILDERKSKITVSVNVPGLVGVQLDRLIPESLSLKIQPSTEILNDALAAAIDIHHSRQLAGRLFTLSIGTGVGAAVLDDGRPLFVEGDSPGHFGQIDVSIPDHDVIAPDSGAGGLEGYIGATAIGNRLESLQPDDPAILALIRALRIAHAIYRPHHICLCGGIGIRLKYMLGIIRAGVENKLTSLARIDWTLSAGDDDWHAARGAARGSRLFRK